MKSNIHTVTSRIWEWEGKGSWHFVTIEEKDEKYIKQNWPWPRRGFGAIPVNVRIGTSIWKTSIFPEKGGSYLLPLKRSVREAQQILKGDTITFELTVIS